MKFVYSKTEAKNFTKAGVSMWVYSTKDDCPNGGALYQEVNGGHYEEFVNHKSAFIYYILEGEGKFVVDDIEYPVKASDVVVIPTNKRFYYLGNLKQVLVTAPAWEEGTEEVIKTIPHTQSLT